MDTTVETAVSWMVNGSVVDTSQDGRVSTDGDTLIFSPLTTSDTGRHTCTLTITVSQMHVTVQGPMQSEVESITVESNTYSLLGDILHVSLPLPQSPSLVWLSLPTTLVLCMLVLASLSHVL